MDPARDWRLSGLVQVGRGNVTLNNAADVAAVRAAGATLTIPAGTNIRALSDGVLLVTRGSQMVANGTQASPITFSSLDDGFAGEGEWGGVVVQGFAPQSGRGNTGACFGTGTVCNVAGEGGAFVGNYAGNDPADNSGVIRYVRIAEGGLIAGPNNEVNGLTLQGVGHGTMVEYVQVHNNLDDGIEWFGGTVNVRYAVLTNNDDDDIDYDEGYRGNVQYGIVVKNQTKPAPTGSNDPRGVEANSNAPNQVSQTNATLANITIVGGPVVNNAASLQTGLRLRGGLTTGFYNMAIRGFNDGCVRIDDEDANADGTLDVFANVTLVNVLGQCTPRGFYRGTRIANTQTNVSSTTVTIDAAFALTESQARLISAPVIPAVDNGSGFVFDRTTYIGAVQPGTAAGAAWWAGWTIPGSLTLAP